MAAGGPRARAEARAQAELIPEETRTGRSVGRPAVAASSSEPESGGAAADAMACITE